MLETHNLPEFDNLLSISLPLYPLISVLQIIIGCFLKHTLLIQFGTLKSLREINFKAYTAEN